MTVKTKTDVLRTAFDQEFHRDAYRDFFDVFVPEVNTKSTVISAQNVVRDQSGADQPKWKTIIANRGDCVNNYDCSSVRASTSNWEAEFEGFVNINPPVQGRPKYRYKMRGEPTLPVVTFPSPIAGVSQQALGPFISRCNRRITQFSSGQFVGELKETIQMFKSPLRGIRGLLEDHLTRVGKNRRRSRSPKQKRKYLAEQWLETSFGIMPLISDIQSAAQAVARVKENLPPAERVSSTASREAVVLESGISTATYGLAGWKYSQLVKDTTSVRYFGAVRLENSGGATRNVFGVRADLFIPTIWELIPYSWLVDYFSNVGNVIEAACFNTSRLQYWGVTTRHRRKTIIRFHGNGSDTSNPDYSNSHASGSNAELEVQVFQRRRQPNLVPSLSFKIPNGYWKWANMLAVKIQHDKLVPY